MNRIPRSLAVAVAVAAVFGLTAVASAQLGVTLGNHYYGTNGSYTNSNPYGSYGYNPYSTGTYSNNNNGWYYDNYNGYNSAHHQGHNNTWNPNRYGNSNYSNRYYGNNGVYRGYGYDHDDHDNGTLRRRR